MAARGFFKDSRSIRTGRKLSGIGKGPKRYDFEAIKNLTDLRSFFYEYSLVAGDIMSLPLVPNFGSVSSLRSTLLKGGRIMGDAKAVGNTLKNLADGVHMSDFEGAGERAFRRFGGRTTGKVLMAVPGQSIFARGARSVMGANMQKEFDSLTKKMFRGRAEGSGTIAKAYGTLNFKGLSQNDIVTKIVEAVTEDVARQAYNFTPVKTGKLRGSLRTRRKDEKVRGGSIPVGEAKIGGGDIDYAMKIEFGEGQGFDIGAGYTKKLFPNTPTSAQTLRSSKNNRRAVNKATGKGAMMRRGATKAMQRFERSGLSQVPEKYNLDAKLRMAINVK
jgi:hypothetical protein